MARTTAITFALLAFLLLTRCSCAGPVGANPGPDEGIDGVAPADPTALVEACTFDLMCSFVGEQGSHEGKIRRVDNLCLLSIPALVWTLLDDGTATMHGRVDTWTL